MSEQNHLLVGTWLGLEETLSEVEYTVLQEADGFHVSAFDTYDGEQGEIHNVLWDEEKQALTFVCHWASTGRFSKCKFHVFAQDKLEFTYTYTDHEILVRKQA